MPIKQTNPYIEEKHNLIRQYEQTKDINLKPRIEELDKKAKEFTQQQINKIQDKIETIREEKNVDTTLSWNKQYKELVRLYREVVELMYEIRDVKKELRGERTNV